MSETPNRLALRLTATEMAALATVTQKITSPLRRPPSTSDAIRAALLHTAATLPAAQEPANGTRP